MVYYRPKGAIMKREIGDGKVCSWCADAGRAVQCENCLTDFCLRKKFQDTTRILTLAESAQEWDSITQQPKEPNVLLPSNLGE